MENAGAGANFTSFNTFTSFDGASGGAAVKRTSTSTRFINGKKITTKKYVWYCEFLMMILLFF